MSPTPPRSIPVSDLVDMVQDLRKNLTRQEQLLEQLSASLQQCQTVIHTEAQSQTIPGWLPEEKNAKVMDLLPELDIHKVERSIGSPDVLARIKQTLIGRAYQKFFKQIPFVRKAVFLLWRKLYPIYSNHIAIHVSSQTIRRWLPLVKLSDFVKISNHPTIKVFDASTVRTPAPNAVPDRDATCLLSPHDQYIFPPVYVAEIDDALVHGGTNLVFTRDAAICHDQYNFERDYTSEELHGRHVIDINKKRMRLLQSDTEPEKIPIAATFIDACAANYAHWLTEVLPRIATFCSVEHFSHVPIIINEGLHRNIMESLAVIVGAGRKIITLPVGRGINIDKLYITSVTGYVPFERRNVKLLDHSHGLFCPFAFDLVRDRIGLLSDQSWLQGLPKRLYLRRTSGSRKVANVVELEGLLAKNGYVAIEPEKLSFLEQVALFSSAESIIGSSGAALSNLIFSSANVRIDILIGKSEHTSFWYWQNISCATGKTVRYVLGEVTESNAGIHSDFRVDVKDVSKGLGLGV